MKGSIWKTKVDECEAEFRFYRENTYKLAEQLQLPVSDEIKSNGCSVEANVETVYPGFYAEYHKNMHVQHNFSVFF